MSKFKSSEELLAKNDVLGTQVAKLNDELAIQESNIRLLRETLQLKEKQSNDRQEDIRMLKIEIQKMRHEKRSLQKKIDHSIDLRHEIFNLERDLKDERIRSRALEELLNTPQNIHRWRKLGEIDPSALELLDQVRLLQKKNLEKSQKIMELKMRSETTKNEKQKPIQANDEEYYNLKRNMIAKNEKIKGLIAELRLKESLIAENRQAKQKSALSDSRKSSSLHSTTKRDDRRNCESAPAYSRAYLKLLKSESNRDSPKRFLGGGYNLTPKQD